MSSVKPCANCKSKVKTKLCFCESIYICDSKCWKEYCDKNEEFDVKCRKALLKKKMDDLTVQQKAASGKKRQLNRDEGGKFTKPTTKPTEEGPSKENKKTKTAEQIEKDSIASKASKKKRLVKKNIKDYLKLVPDNKISIRELKKKGRAEIWYSSPGYNPLQSRLSSDTDETDANSAVLRDAEGKGDSTSDDTVQDEHIPPNIEDIREDAILQERSKINVRQFCAICNQKIGLISKRLKCNENGCLSHSSVHLACLGLYPSSVSDRKIIQKSFFCSDHRPEPVAPLVVPPEEREDDVEAEQSTSNASNGQSKKATKSSRKSTKKRKVISHVDELDAASDVSSIVVAKKSTKQKQNGRFKSSSKKSPKDFVPITSNLPPLDENVNNPSVSFMSPPQVSSPTLTESSSDEFVILSTPSPSWGNVETPSFFQLDYTRNVPFNQM